MAQDTGKQDMQRLLQTLSRKDVKNGAKMNFGLNLLARYRKLLRRAAAKAARWCTPGCARA